MDRIYSCFHLIQLGWPGIEGVQCLSLAQEFWIGPADLIGEELQAFRQAQQLVGFAVSNRGMQTNLESVKMIFAVKTIFLC